MTLSDSVGDSFDSSPQVPNIQEATATTPQGTDTCWYSGSDLPKNPGVSGGHWSVGSVGGRTEHNHWGYDSIGPTLSDISILQQFGTGNGVTFPCTLTIYQVMQIMRNANTWWPYRQDTITITVNHNPNWVKMCRDGICGLPVDQ